MFREFYAQHPIASWVFGIGAALVIVWAMFGRVFQSSSSGGQTVISNTPSDSQIAAATQIQAAQIAAAADSKRADNELQLGLAGLSLANTEALAKAQLDARSLDLNFNLQSMGLASAERIDIAHTQASTDQFSLAAALDQARDENATAVELEGIKQNAAVNQALINSNVQIASISASVAKKKSSNGLLGGIIGAIVGIFSDARLKKNIVPLYRREDGVIVYEWEYTAEAFALDNSLPRGRVRGVIAQQIAATPKAGAITYQSGYRKVDYAALGRMH